MFYNIKNNIVNTEGIRQRIFQRLAFDLTITDCVSSLSPDTLSSIFPVLRVLRITTIARPLKVLRVLLV